jgi:transcriptional regulator GlxA family with amidase domain
MKKISVGIVIFEDIEVLDFCGPFEVFSATRINSEKRREQSSPFEVLLVAEKNTVVSTSGGMKVIPDHSFASCPRLNVLVVPGGWGTRREINNQLLLDWLCTQASEVETLTSVCTGAMLLAQAGLLDGLHATTHWQSLDWMQQSFPKVIVEYDKNVVENGHVFTSAGISAGIDMGLRVVASYCGEQVARATAKYMEYPYPDNNLRKISF